MYCGRLERPISPNRTAGVAEAYLGTVWSVQTRSEMEADTGSMDEAGRGTATMSRRDDKKISGKSGGGRNELKSDRRFDALDVTRKLEGCYTNWAEQREPKTETKARHLFKKSLFNVLRFFIPIL
jgi:hypothetical protein